MPDDSRTTQYFNQDSADWLIDACLQCGIDQFFLAPGSRCTPLTLAIADRPACSSVLHFDERGLAFACLGSGRATQRPGVFVCTSGTAVANALPAVIEASQDHVPMLLLTADRPPELRSAGANQTVDQVNLFGPYTRWFFDLPCSAPQLPRHFWFSTVRHAIEHSGSGPVQLNCMFREPFTVTRNHPLNPTIDGLRSTLAVRPELNVSCHWRVPVGRTIVIVGSCTREEALAAERLANRIQCPLLADITSHLRSLCHDLQLIRSDNPPPDVVVHVGGRVVSKRWWQFLDTHPPQHLLHLTPYAERLDPIHRVTQTLHGPLISLCDGAIVEQPSPAEFRQDWLEVSEISRRAATDVIGAETALNEPALARVIAELVPHDSGLLLGNSMPIRDMDQFGSWPDGRAVYVAANRGASGIDGLIATAAGFAAGRQRTTTAVIGDLAALHDLNSLALLAASSVPIILVIVNNDGGGIFHFLPIAQETHHFERYFATPHGRRFADAARMFGLKYDQPTSLAEFAACYRQAIGRDRSAIIEVVTARNENMQLHQRIDQQVRQAAR